MSSSAPVIVALDFDNQHAALSLAEQLDPTQCRLKVGKELFTAAGPTLVKALVERNFDVFLDLKFHDIPNTAAKAVSAAADLGVWMANVHASGGSRMMSAAREALEQQGSPMLLIGVTVLTSMDESDLLEIGIQRSPSEQVLHLAQ
jgi:orotidine-5'-phosphate decarboxylase